MKRILTASICVLLAVGAFADVGRLQLDFDAIAEAIPLVMEAMEINERAMEREQKHIAGLRKKGVAEVEPSRAAVKYSIDTAGVGSFLFDDWGELYIDRRFVTDEEMKTIHKIEAFIGKWFPKVGEAKKRHRPRKTSGGAGLPVFRGFEDARYQMHDALISRLVADFNANKAKW